MNLSDLFRGVGAAGRPLQTAVYTTATNGAVTTQACYFIGYEFTALAGTLAGAVTFRKDSVTGTIICYAGPAQFNAGYGSAAGNSVILPTGVYCPNGLYASNMSLSNTYLNVFYALA